MTRSTTEAAPKDPATTPAQSTSLSPLKARDSGKGGRPQSQPSSPAQGGTSNDMTFSEFFMNAVRNDPTRSSRAPKEPEAPVHRSGEKTPASGGIPSGMTLLQLVESLAQQQADPTQTPKAPEPARPPEKALRNSQEESSSSNAQESTSHSGKRSLGNSSNDKSVSFNTTQTDALSRRNSVATEVGKTVDRARKEERPHALSNSEKLLGRRSSLKPHPKPPPPATACGPAEIVKRAIALTNLFEALHAGDTALVTELLAELPNNHTQLSDYFPPAPSILSYTPYADLLQKALLYHQDAPSTFSKGLLELIDDCSLRAIGSALVRKDHEGIPQGERDNKYPPEVRQLCMAFRDTDVLNLKSQAAQLKGLIAGISDFESLDTELVQQPYASLSMMLVKCTLLEEHTDPQTVAPLRAAITSAIQTRTQVTGELREQLLNSRRDSGYVASLAMAEYAKEMTTGVYLLCDRATPEQIRTLHSNIQAEMQNALMVKVGLRAEQAALWWLTQQIGKTAQQLQ